MSELNLNAFLGKADPDILKKAHKNKVVFVDLNEVHPNPLNMFPVKDVERYAENIMMTGLLNPITIIDKPEGHVIFAGHTRCEALNSLMEKGFHYSYEGDDITGKVPALIIPPFENEIDERIAMISSNYTKNLTSEEKERLIDECVDIINAQRIEDANVKGRTAHIVASMLPFAENFIKTYLAKKNKEEEIHAEEQENILTQKKNYDTICKEMKRLSDNLMNFDWKNCDIDKRRLSELYSTLKVLLDEKLGDDHDNGL